MIEINLKPKRDLRLGDCLEQLRLMPENSVDSVVTDPPYGLSFMGKKWDYDVPSSEVFREILRVLKPGGHMLCACGTRTQHRMAVNIEDAGFEIRDVITWLYGSGFPKSMDISKAIDKQAGVERNLANHTRVDTGFRFQAGGTDSLPPQTLHAKQWQGWGTALKPACEFWTLARKPLSEKTVAANILKHGTGGVNIDGCRTGTETMTSGGSIPDIRSNNYENANGKDRLSTPVIEKQGRWPANLILDEEAAELLDKQSGTLKSGGGNKRQVSQDGGYGKGFVGTDDIRDPDSGGASRFFYVAKAGKSERNSGLENLPAITMDIGDERPSGSSGERYGKKPTEPRKNVHPTVKPVKLMTYLCRLITPPRSIVLDPFMGSGSTGVAAVKEGFSFIGIEREPSYFEICKSRIEAAREG